MDKIMGRFIRELEEAEVCLHSVALIYRGNDVRGIFRKILQDWIRQPDPALFTQKPHCH